MLSALVQGPPARAFSALASASADVPCLRILPLRAVAACCLLLATSQNVAPQNSRNGPRKFQKRCCLQPATGPCYFLIATCSLLLAACNLLLSTLLDGAIPRSGLLHLVYIYIYIYMYIDSISQMIQAAQGTCCHGFEHVEHCRKQFRQH